MAILVSGACSVLSGVSSSAWLYSSLAFTTWTAADTYQAGGGFRDHALGNLGKLSYFLLGEPGAHVAGGFAAGVLDGLGTRAKEFMAPAHEAVDLGTLLNVGSVTLVTSAIGLGVISAYAQKDPEYRQELQDKADRSLEAVHSAWGRTLEMAKEYRDEHPEQEEYLKALPGRAMGFAERSKESIHSAWDSSAGFAKSCVSRKVEVE